MRQTLDNPRRSPALGAAIRAAEEIGCTLGKGYTLGNTVIGIDLTGPKGELFSVEFRPENFRKGGDFVRQKAANLGIIPRPGP